jgi:hypothetical protein
MAVLSKGFGRVERALVATMARISNTKLVDTFELAAKVYQIQPGADGAIVLSDAHVVSVRRALNSLAKRGLVSRIMRGHNKRPYWGNAQYAGPRSAAW